MVSAIHFTRTLTHHLPRSLQVRTDATNIDQSCIMVNTSGTVAGAVLGKHNGFGDGRVGKGQPQLAVVGEPLAPSAHALGHPPCHHSPTAALLRCPPPYAHQPAPLQACRSA